MTLPTNEGRAPRPAPTIDLAAGPGDRETRRELAKLTATFLNGVAVAIFAVGVLTPLVTYMLEPGGTPSGLVIVAISTISF